MTRLVKWEDNVQVNIGIDLGEEVVLVGANDEESRVLADYQEGKVEDLIEEGVKWLGKEAILDYGEVEKSINFEVLDYMPGDTYRIAEIYEAEEKEKFVIKANDIERIELSNGDVYEESYLLPDGRRIAVDEAIGQWVMLG